MNLEDLYEDIKAAIRFLGVDWDQKELVAVTTLDGCLIFEHGGRSVSIRLEDVK